MSAQPELVCARCQPTEDENARLRQALEAIQFESNELAQELAGARATLRTIERQKAALQAELTKAREENPKVKEIMAFQEYWKVATGQTSARISSKGKRFKDAEQAFRLANADELREAVRGAVLRPWSAFGRRYVTRDAITDRKEYEKAEIKLSVYDIVGSDDKIEKHRQIYVEAQADIEKNPDALIAAWRQVQAVEAEYALLVMKLAGANDREVEPSESTIKALAEADRVIAFLDAADSERPKLELAA